MKKLFYLILLIAGFVNGQIVNIPDANFKAKLLSATPDNTVAYALESGSAFPVTVYIDSNFDGEIEISEIQNITSLNLANANITNLEGVQLFPNLQNLDFSNNNISSLYFIGMPNLTSISCNNNSNFTVSDLNQLVNLRFLSIDNCGFTNLNVANLQNLQFLFCNSSNMTSLILGNNTSLIQIACSNNNLVTLDLSGLTNLMFLSCNHNNLNVLDISNLYNLKELYCGDNPFTTLNCNNNYKLTGLSFQSCNNLETLFLHNGSDESINYNMWMQNWGYLSSLQYMCADENEISSYEIYANTLNPSPIQINSYCSFTPGGDYNTIRGSVLSDANNNGCDDNDFKLPYIKLNINDGTNEGAAFTGNLDNYKFYTQSGNFTITPILENPIYFNISPSNSVVNFPLVNNSISTQYFCITPNGIHPDLEIVLAPVTPARPGFDAVYKIVYKNIGNQTLSGNVYFYYDDTILDFVSASVAPVQTLGLLTWAYADLLPFETRSFLVTLNVNSPIETPSVNIDDQLILNAATNPVNGNEITFSLAQTVVGSYDPNDIACLEGATISPSEIGNYLHYMVNFENTGNYAAENVVVKIEIDTDKFDVASLQLLDSSNPVDARVTGNKVEFIFKNIQLAGPGGHGNILLKIKTKNNLVTGDIVSKNANIYFDYNAPVTTLPFDTTFQTLGLNNTNLDDSIAVFPNPTSNFVTVKSKNAIKSLQLFDVQCRLLQTNLSNQNESKMDISAKANGVYFLKITSEVGVKIERVVKQ